MKATVTTSFPGRIDGEPLPRTIEVGEIISGDLAVVAVREQWAEAMTAAAAVQTSPLDGMTVAQLKAYAEANSIDLGEASKKDDIRAVIELALEAKAA